MSLLYIGEQLTIYGGSFLVVTGVIGNGMNIIVFSSVRTYRTSPCAFYFLIGSMFNIATIMINLITRILSVGYDLDLTRTSIIWCKTRQFFIITFSLISFTCSCLATIHQFLVTSQNISLRRFNNIKWAHRIVFITIIVWCLHGIPCFIVFNISSITKLCVTTSPAYRVYIPIYILGLICAIPVLIMIVFGYLTYRNIHLIGVVVKQADRQLTKMTLIQVVLAVISMTPYGINYTYHLIISRVNLDTNELLREDFISTILGLVTYFYYVGSCYMFLISSSRFRRTIKRQIFCWQKPNRILPF